MISIKNLHKVYNNRTIIDGISYNIKPGSKLGISGRNGSGKSTLIQLITGYLTPTSGSIVWQANNKAIDQENWYQYYSITAPYIEPVNELQVNDALQFHFAHKQLIPNIKYKDLEAVIGYPLDQPIGNLSSGMYQRLKLILGIMSQSMVLILDEPTEYLDSESKQWCYDLINLYLLNRTLIVASNDSEDLNLTNEIITL